MASGSGAAKSKTNWEKLWEALFRMEGEVTTESENNNNESFLIEDDQFKRIKAILNFLATFKNKPIPDITEKSRPKVLSHWKTANDYIFNQSNYSVDFCIEEYTKSIAAAPNGSYDLAMSYQNRSTVLCSANLMEDCITDIERVFEIGFPDHLKAHLFYRISKCLRALNPEDPRIEEASTETKKYLEKMPYDPRKEAQLLMEKEKDSVFTDDTQFYRWNIDKTRPVLQENPMIPGLSNAVELKYDPKYGRHMVATRDIRPGEYLAAQKPYARIPQWQNRYKICWNCSRQVWSSIPCENCADVIFCSKTCRDKANAEHHDIECPIIRIMIAFKLHDKLFLCLRLFVKGFREMGNSLTALKDIVEEIDSQRDPLTRGFTNNVMDPEKFSTIYGFTKNDGNDKFSCQSVLLAYLLATKTEIFGGKFNLSLRSLKVNKKLIFVARLLEKLLRLSINNSSEDLLYTRINTTVRVTHSIVPVHNFFNHQCFPSATSGYHGDFRVCRSITYIRKGEQIFYTYGENNFFSKLKTDRQRDLYRSYEFLCDCHACLGEWPRYTMTVSMGTMNIDQPVTSTGIIIPRELHRIQKDLLPITWKYYEEKVVRQPDILSHVNTLREIIESLKPNVAEHDWFLLCAELYLEKYLQLLENRFVSPDHYF